MSATTLGCVIGCNGIEGFIYPSTEWPLYMSSAQLKQMVKHGQNLQEVITFFLDDVLKSFPIEESVAEMQNFT